MSGRPWCPIGCLVLAGLPGISASPLAAASATTMAPALVTKTIVRTSTVLVEVRTDDGEVVVSTPDHPFARATSRGHELLGWSRSNHLAVGDRLVSLPLGGATAEIISVSARHGRPVAVFNLVVSRSHAYAVGIGHLLVHNGKCKTSEELEAERRQLDDLISERKRLKDNGDPEHKLKEIRKEIHRLQVIAGNARLRDRNPGKLAALKKAKYHRDAEFRQLELARFQRNAARRSRQKAMASLVKNLESDEGDQGLGHISEEAIHARVDELTKLFRERVEPSEPGGPAPRAASEEDLSALERQVESGAGVDIGTTSALERDFAREKSQFWESLADVQERIDAYDSMSGEVAAHFSGMREELTAEELSLLTQRREQIESEMEVTSRQLQLMSKIPELREGAAQSALEHQLRILNAELGALPGTPPP